MEYKMLLAGDRVVLNPESPEYDRINQVAKGNAGYVIDHKCDDNDVRHLLKSTGDDIVRNWSVTVGFDNGERHYVRIKHLLHVDAEPKVIKKVEFNTGEMIIGGEEYMDNKLDEYIIVKGWTPRNVRVFDSKWREEIMEPSSRVDPFDLKFVVDDLDIKF